MSRERALPTPAKIAALACVAMLGSSSIAQGPDHSAMARRLFDQRQLSGAALIQDVRTGSPIVQASVGDGPNGLPLSTVKLLLMTLYWEHRADLPASLAPDVDRIIAQGADDPGRRLAFDL